MADRQPWYLRPAFLVAALIVVAAIAILRQPPGVDVESQARLTTYSADPYGARGLSDVLQRLGWRVDRSLEPLREELDTGAVYAVLAPPIDLTAVEAHRLLEAVRAGASLVAVPTRGSTLADSIGIRQTWWGRRKILGPDDALDEPVDEDAPWLPLDPVLQTECPGDPFWQPHGTVYLMHALAFSHALHPDTVTFLAVREIGSDDEEDGSDDTTAASQPEAHEDDLTARPAAIGMRFGRGRIVLLADPNLLRNDVIRMCESEIGVIAVRMFQWAAGDDPTPRVVFDEYHQGFGAHASVSGAIRAFLTETPPGRTLLQLVIAALALLLLLAIRPIPPRSRERIERRSPLEHVGALARAYAQVGATRTATRRLVAGLRRRHAHGAAGRMSDEEFLRAAAARHPRLEDDVRLVLQAEARPLPPAQFPEVGTAIERIERTLTP